MHPAIAYAAPSNIGPADESIIYNIKYNIEHGSYTEFLEQLTELIKNKNNEIRVKCELNSNVFFQNIKAYVEIRNNITRINSQITSFEEQLNKISLRNKYDTSQVKKQQNAIENIDNTITLLTQASEVITNLSKAIKSLQNEKYMACIRMLALIKKKPLLTQQANSSIKRIFNDFQPYINNKIHKRLDVFLNEWAKQIKVKQAEFGTVVLACYEDNFKATLQTNLQDQHYKTTLNVPKADNKESKRESLYFNRSSINRNLNDPGHEQSLRISVSRKGSITKPESSSSQMRQSFIFNSETAAKLIATQKEDQAAGPKNFNIQLVQKRVLASQGLKTIVDSSRKERFFDFKIDFYLINQSEQIYDQLNELPVFLESLKMSRTQQLLQICEQERVINPQEMRQYSAQIIGYFLVTKELEKRYAGMRELESLWIEALKKIEKRISLTFKELHKPDDLLQIKQELHLFSFVVQQMGYNSTSFALLQILKDNYMTFCEKMFENLKPELQTLILGDNFISMQAKSREEYEYLVKVFDVRRDVLGGSMTTSTISVGESMKASRMGLSLFLPFSKVLPEILALVNKFLKQNILYFRGLNETEGKIHLQIDRTFFIVYEVYRAFVDVRTPEDSLQLCQASQHLFHIQNLIKYIKNLLEEDFKFPCGKDYESPIHMEQLRFQAEELMRESLFRKIDVYLSLFDDPKQVNWTPKTANKMHHPFVEDMTDYLCGALNSFKIVSPEVVTSLIYLVFKHINTKIFDIMAEGKAKEINVAGLVNLELDLLFLFNICGTHFGEYINLMECLRGLRQFLDIFLVKGNDAKDLLDKNKRMKNYYNLDMRKTILIFAKYKKLEAAGLPVVSRTNVRDVMDKLKKELGIV